MTSSDIAYTPILPFMVEALHLSASQAGLIASANFIGYFAGALLAALRFPGSRRVWLLGALVLLFVPKENKDAVRWIANFFALAGLLVSLPLVPWFWAQRFEPGFKFMEGAPNNWIPTIGAHRIAAANSPCLSCRRRNRILPPIEWAMTTGWVCSCAAIGMTVSRMTLSRSWS